MPVLLAGEVATGGMTQALTDLATAVSSMVDIMSTGKLAIFFYAAVAVIAIKIVRSLKKTA